MDCPRCQSDQIDDSGVCPSCGYRIPASAPIPFPEQGEAANRNISGMIEMDYAERKQAAAQDSEKPRWRQELSERLQAIKQKKEALESSRSSGGAAKSSTFSNSSTQSVKPSFVPKALSLDAPLVRKSTSRPPTPIPRQKKLEPLPQEVAAGRASAKPADPEDIRSLIDNAISRRTSPPGESEEVAGFFDSSEKEFPEDEGKLIFLSRTLCGLVDLIIVLLCTGISLIAADFFSGIIALDAVSYIYFSLLFLLTFFFYSLFFLTASNQTIGMMITNLRVVGVFHERPSFRQLLQRCTVFLISLLGLGFGLFWGLFDRESLCFHDRISDTQVVRV